MGYDYDYCMNVVSAQKEILRKAEAMGDVGAMRSCVESICRNLRKAASLSPNKRGELLGEAESFEGYVERYLALPKAKRPVVRQNAFEDDKGRENPDKDTEKDEGDTTQREEQGEYDFGRAQLISSTSKTTFDDIVGMQDVKEEIERKLINPLKYPEVFARHNLYPGGYTLLWGPPGTGKTTFARAVASQIGVPFFMVRGTELVDKYLGETGKEIRKVFTGVRKYSKDKNTPVVLFIDEIDAISKKRESGDTAAGAAVPTLLQELEGFDTDSKNLIIIAATNVKSTMDSGVLSRFTCIYVPLPDKAARKAIMQLKLKAYCVSESDVAQLDLDEAAERSEGMGGREITKAIESFANDVILQEAGEKSIDEPLTQRLLKYLDKHRLTA